MKYKVIFDTNSIRNSESEGSFLGGRPELKRFLKVSEIIIPDIVIEEIKHQKIKKLTSKRDSFLSNPFHFLRKINKTATENFDIEQHILDIAQDESLPYSVIKLTNDVLADMRKLSLGNLPPFDEKSDKGFKDAYIYFTILEYLDDIKDKNIFVVTKDERLSLSFKDNRRITVIRNYDEFGKYIVTYFRDEYFINRLEEEISEFITVNCIKDIWLNTKENWVIKLACDEKTYFVEVDFSSREIIDYTDFDFAEGIKRLIVAEAFLTVHSNIAAIKDYTQYFSDYQIQRLIEAATNNNQIYWIAEDEDVKEFFMRIFKAKLEIIEDKDILVQFKEFFFKQ